MKRLNLVLKFHFHSYRMKKRVPSECVKMEKEHFPTFQYRTELDGISGVVFATEGAVLP